MTGTPVCDKDKDPVVKPTSVRFSLLLLAVNRVLKPRHSDFWVVAISTAN